MHTRTPAPLFSLFILLTCAAVSGAQEGGSGVEVLTNDKVVTMVKNGLPASIIVNKIRVSKTNFNVETANLIRLKQAKVPDEVINAMLEASAPKTVPPPNTVDTPSDPSSRSTGNDIKPNTTLRKEKAVEGPEAFLLDKQGKLPLDSLFPAIIQTKAKGDNLVTAMANAELSSLGSEVVTKGATAALMAIPGASIPIMMTSGALVRRLPKFIHNPVLTFVYALAHGRSSNVIASHTPKFEVRFADITGADPDDFQAAIVKLTATKNNWRLLGLKQAKQSAFESSERTEYSFKEELIGTRVTKIARGIFEIEPARPLVPGEYGIVIRPVSETYKVSPKDAVIKAGEGLLLLPIWDFSVDARER